MPKKTKRQKMAAAYHKKIRLLQKDTPSVVPVKNVSGEKIIKEAAETKEIMPENSFFFSDLKKSLILVSVVIALEIALYFARIIK